MTDNLAVAYHLHDPDVLISVESLSYGGIHPCPVIYIGNIRIFPTLEMLERLRDVVVAYLEAEAKR